jgi:cytochrome o ubiquinol oxidase operon protein cyoD
MSDQDHAAGPHHDTNFEIDGSTNLLAVLAIAQMGVHLVFFMHVNATEEGENTALALGFGIFIVFLVVFGSIIIMNNLSGTMPSMEQLMKMQR